MITSSKLYGASTKRPVCLLMELAEASLYDGEFKTILHQDFFITLSFESSSTLPL